MIRLYQQLIAKLLQIRDILKSETSVNMPANPDALLPWGTIEGAHHNVRAICDLQGLTFEQKNTLTACVKVESGFLTNPKPNVNRDKDGVIWSKDWGIVQVNDYFHIGPDKDFPSVEYVLNNPGVCVQWMADFYKEHDNLQPWDSYKSGAYKDWLGRV